MGNMFNNSGLSLSSIKSSLVRKSQLLRKGWLLYNTLSDKITGENESIIPNLIIIGAQKSGTTSLHNYLNQHPDIFMPHFKEPGYFLDPTDDVAENTTRNKLRLDLSDNDLLKLMSFGYRGEKYFGDSSTYYSMHPVFGQEVPSNIFHRSPSSKLIYVLRNPYERIVSQFLWGERNNFSQGKFADVLSSRFDIISSISSYALQIEHYLEFFDKGNIFVLDFEMLKADPAESIKNILKFLGLNESIADSFNYKQYYVSTNRESHQKKDLLFPKELFLKFDEIISPDVSKLDNLVDSQLSRWDLSEETWCA